MNERTMQLDHDALSELLNDPNAIRIVTVVNLASLSALELLEYGFTRGDINRALAKGIIQFEKAPFPQTQESAGNRDDNIPQLLESGDYYFKHLSRKMILTKLGLYILETIESRSQDELESKPVGEQSSGLTELDADLAGYASSNPEV
jgi:hypothetical protein